MEELRKLFDGMLLTLLNELYSDQTHPMQWILPLGQLLAECSDANEETILKIKNLFREDYFHMLDGDLSLDAFKAHHVDPTGPIDSLLLHSLEEEYDEDEDDSLELHPYVTYRRERALKYENLDFDSLNVKQSTTFPASSEKTKFFLVQSILNTQSSAEKST